MPKFDLRYVLLRFKIKAKDVVGVLKKLEGLEIVFDGKKYGKVVNAGITSGEFDIQVLIEVKNPEIARYLPDIVQSSLPKEVKEAVDYSNNVFWYKPVKQLFSG